MSKTDSGMLNNTYLKGLRSDGLKNYLERKRRENVNTGDGSTLVKISGCEYKISEERLNDVLTGLMNHL